MKETKTISGFPMFVLFTIPWIIGWFWVIGTLLNAIF